MKISFLFYLLFFVFFCFNNTFSQFKSEEVLFEHSKAKLAGTLTIPDSGTKFPAIVLVTGSGQQNRDSEVYGFKIFKILAEHFSEKGIAVLRYDDRGIGGSKGELKTATTLDFSEDAIAAINYLKSRNEIDTNRIGILGHSEGGIISLLVSEKIANLAFIVFLSSPAIQGKEIINFQVKAALKQSEATEEEIKENLDLQQLVYDAIDSKIDWDSIEKRFINFNIESLKKLPEEKRKNITNFEEFAKFQVKRQLTPAKSNWFKFFINYNPYSALTKLKCPILAIFAGLDKQVEPDLNMNVMGKAFNEGGVQDYLIKVFPNANHLYQEAKTGNYDEYMTLDKNFVNGLPQYISGWILETLGRIDKK